MTIQTTRLDDSLYSDFNTDLDLHPVSDDLAVLTNADAVKRSVRSLLLTNHYERPFRPQIGGHLTALLFEPITPSTEFAIRSSVRQCITNHEPRARLIDVLVTALPDRNSYSCTVIFAVINLDQPIILDVILRRLR